MSKSTRNLREVYWARVRGLVYLVPLLAGNAAVKLLAPDAQKGQPNANTQILAGRRRLQMANFPTAIHIHQDTITQEPTKTWRTRKIPPRPGPMNPLQGKSLRARTTYVL